MENAATDTRPPPPEAKGFLAELGEEVKEGFRKNRRVMSFAEFLALVNQHPYRHLRGAAQYVKDCFDHFGTAEVDTPRGPQTRYLLFDCPFAGGKDRLIGQEEVQGKIYRSFCNFVRDGRISKLVLLHGPNGSAKSTLIACIMRALEHYSTLEEGAIYRFNWIFPSQKLTRGGIGFGGQVEEETGGADSYAYLDDAQIDVKLTDETLDHPLLLIPLQKRRQLIAELIARPKGDGAAPKFVLCDYVGGGDLSPRNKQIFEALLVSYKGDILKVLRHIQVERFYISRRYRQGAVTVEPQMAVDATAQQITADRSLSALPPALQALNLLRYDGEVVQANRGIIEFADLLKRPLEAYKYLLGTVEHARVPVGSHILYLDEIFIASSNDLHLSAFKEIPEFQSFKGRMELVRVPYLLDYTEEQKIYEEQLQPSAVGKHVAPHAARVAALWGVLTRMRKPMAERYDKPLADIVSKLSAFDKVELYAHRRAPAHLTPEQSKELLGHLDAIYSESDSYPIYEGRVGISPRELKTLLLNAAQHPRYRCLSPFAVLEEIDELLKAVTVHEFLKQEPLPGGYHDHRKFVEIVREELLNIIDEEVRSAMGLIDERQYTEVLARYINHISHFIKREKVVNPVTGDLEEPDEKLMTEIERTLGVSGSKEEHRRDMIRQIAAWSIDHPEEAQRAQKSGRGLGLFDYARIFPEHFRRLREAYFAERKKILKKTNLDLLAYLSEEGEARSQPPDASLDRESAERVRKTFETLKERYGYDRECARDAVSYLVRKRYA